ncbi:MAG: glycosyltransferase [Clostridia bacterium]
MIPKIIHYCWFGGNPLPEKDTKFIDTWKKFCPDYEIKCWNESNYDVTKNKYMYEAYKAKKWGFVPDYARLDIIYNHGGIYLDTDVEIIKNFDELLANKAFMGFESQKFVNLGNGFGAEKNNETIKKIMDTYDNLKFIKDDGTYNITPSPILNSKELENMGFIMNNELQETNSTKLYPQEYFCPKDYDIEKIILTENTFSIHHWNSSWYTLEQEKRHKKAVFFRNKFGRKFGEYIYLATEIPVKIKQYGLGGLIKRVFKR